MGTEPTDKVQIPKADIRLLGPMAQQQQESRLARLQGQFSLLVAAVVVLVIFSVLAYLVQDGLLSGESLVFFAGLIVGYLARAGTDWN